VRPWKVILAAAVIFACGVLTGLMVAKTNHPALPVPANPPAVAVNPKNPAPPGWQMQRLEFFRKMQRQLDLDPKQQQEINQIVKESQERVKPLWDQIGPQMNAELERVRDEVGKVLTPEQQKKMNELMRRGHKSEGGSRNGRLSHPAGTTQVESNAPDQKALGN
jgi:Spy/CpxP family protein refolding chaperone